MTEDLTAEADTGPDFSEYVDQGAETGGQGPGDAQDEPYDAGAADPGQ